MGSNLIRMANDIAAFHHSFSESEAMQMVSEHINKFWTPAMRQRLFEEFQNQPDAFNSLIAKSLLRIACSRYNPVKPVFQEQHGTGG